MAADAHKQFQLAVTAHREGDHAGAIRICDAILAQVGELPEVLNLKALAQAEGGQMVLARETILAALEAANEDSSAEARSLLHLHAARILAGLDLYREAFLQAGQATRLAPGNPGHAYQHVRLALLSGETERAGELLERWIDRYPGFEELRILQCQLRLEQGDLEAAATALEAVVAQNPGHARAWSGLADISRASPGDAPVGEALQEIYAQGPGAEAEFGDWATAALALAAIHRRRGDSRLAFSLSREGNKHLRDEVCWDIDSWESDVEATLSMARRHDHGTSATAAPRPLLIVGMPRSGTTLLEQVLAAHPAISASGERSALLHIQRHLEASGQEGAPAGLGTDEGTLESMGALYRAGMDADPDTLWVTDKAPRNFERIGLALSLFPDCKVIWMVRHPADTILSCYFTDFQHGLAFSHSLMHLARTYRGHWRLMRKWTECYSESIHRLDYAHLVRDPEAAVRQLCEFLGVAFEAAMLRPELQAAPARTASVLQVQRPINDSAVDRWRDFEEELSEVIDYLRRHGLMDDQDATPTIL